MGNTGASEAMSALDKQEGGNHYKSLKIQPVEYINANEIPYLEGNVIKYVTRHASKGGVNDIDKAIHYLELIKQFAYSDNVESKTKNTKISLDKFFELGFELVVYDEFVGTDGRVMDVTGPTAAMNHSLESAHKNRFVYSLVWRGTEYYANRVNLIETRGEQWRPNLKKLIELYGEP